MKYLDLFVSGATSTPHLRDVLGIRILSFFSLLFVKFIIDIIHNDRLFIFASRFLLLLLFLFQHSDQRESRQCGTKLQAKSIAKLSSKFKAFVKAEFYALLKAK